jgi:hypothetical protein
MGGQVGLERIPFLESLLRHMISLIRSSHSLFTVQALSDLRFSSVHF